MTPRHLAHAIIRHARHHPARAALAIMLTAASVLSLWLLARWGGAFVPALLSPSVRIDELLADAILGVMLLAVVTASTAARDVTLSTFAASLVDGVRARMLGALVRQPLGVGDERHVGASIARVAGDVTLLHQALTRVLSVWLPAVIASAVLLVASASTSPALAIATVVLVAPSIVVTSWFGRTLQGATHEAQHAASELGHVLGEAMAGVREAKVYRREASLQSHLEYVSRWASRLLIREERLALTSPAAMTFVASFSLAVVVLLAAWGTRAGFASGHDVSRFLFLLAVAVAPLQESLRSFGATTRATALLERCEAIAASAAESDEPACAELVDSGPGVRLDMERATVERPTSGFVLGPLDLRAEPGDVLVVSGASGAGKSTLLDVIPRLIELTSGTLRIDGTDARTIRRSALRRVCAYVPQEPYFFAGTIAENLAFGAPNASRDAMRHALLASHSSEFVDRLPGSLDCMLTSGAHNLSVGQRRRLALARAFLVAPRLLLLDEPTAGLDPDSEALVVDALGRLSGSCTMVIATHSPAVQSLADRVLSLHRGRQVAMHDASAAVVVTA